MRSKVSGLAVAVCFCTLILGAYSAAGAPQTRSQSAAEREARLQVLQSYGNLPMRFELNAGQADPEVRFVSHDAGYTLLLAPSEAILEFRTAMPPQTGQK